jgi:hypothetical protein
MNTQNIINYLLGLIIILLILKLILRKYEPFESSLLDCKNYPFLCNKKLLNPNNSLYTDKRQSYLTNVLEIISPRYNPSSRKIKPVYVYNKYRRPARRVVLSRNRYYDPHKYA